MEWSCFGLCGGLVTVSNCRLGNIVELFWFMWWHVTVSNCRLGNGLVTEVSNCRLGNRVELFWFMWWLSNSK